MARCYRSPKTCPPIELSYVAGALLGLAAGLCFDWLAQRRDLKPAWRAAAVLLAIAVVAYILILPALQAAREFGVKPATAIYSFCQIT